MLFPDRCCSWVCPGLHLYFRDRKTHTYIGLHSVPQVTAQSTSSWPTRHYDYIGVAKKIDIEKDRGMSIAFVCHKHVNCRISHWYGKTCTTISLAMEEPRQFHLPLNFRANSFRSSTSWKSPTFCVVNKVQRTLDNSSRQLRSSNVEVL